MCAQYIPCLRFEYLFNGKTSWPNRYLRMSRCQMFQQHADDSEVVLRLLLLLTFIDLNFLQSKRWVDKEVEILPPQCYKFCKT